MRSVVQWQTRNKVNLLFQSSYKVDKHCNVQTRKTWIVFTWIYTTEGNSAAMEQKIKTNYAVRHLKKQSHWRAKFAMYCVCLLTYGRVQLLTAKLCPLSCKEVCDTSYSVKTFATVIASWKNGGNWILTYLCCRFGFVFYRFYFCLFVFFS